MASSSPPDAFRGGAPRAVITATGKDAAAFLHRLSTQHVSGLSPGEARLSVLTTDKGRVVDLVHHVMTGPERVLLVGHATDSATLMAWLDRYCFTEAVTFDAVDATVAVVDAAAAEAVLSGAAGLAPWAAVGGEGLMAIRTFDAVDADGAAVPQVVLVVSGDDGVRAAGALLDVGDAVAGFAAAVAAGVPWLELSGAHTPLDLELHDAIHWAKGCYIGQEVIARLDTYGKQRKRLVGVVADAALAVGDEIVVGDVVVGAVTSVVVGDPLSPSAARALALVKMGEDALPATGHTQGAGPSQPVRVLRRHAAQRPHN